jgi:hypothetical protein
MRRVGLIALVGGFIVAASVVLQQVGLNVPSGKSSAEQLVFEHAHKSRLVYTSSLQALGVMLFVAPLVFLFRSASGRAQRMRGAFLPLIVLGPLAFGLGLAISSVGSTKASDKFHTQEPAAVERARQQAEQAQATQSKPVQKGKTSGANATGSTAIATTTPTTTANTTTGTGSTTINLNGTTTTVPTPITPDQAGSNVRENLADHINKHTTLVIVGGLISTLGVLALVFGMIYTNLWTMRTGLLTRFWGALGMAFGLFLIIPIFPPIPGLVLWFASIGLMFLRLWPRPLPPAWDAGEAVPWQRAGDDLGQSPGADQASGGTVEGSGREVSEAPLPEDGDGEQGQALDEYGQTQGQRRKKRKRRS